jgi:putative SOS response-associated peptidase YedK
MCFHYKQTKEGLVLEKQFNAKKKPGINIEPVAYFNGFEHPKSVIITDKNPDVLDQGIWGLLPNWAKDEKHQDFTLNARVEDITTTNSYKDTIQNRCLIVADGFYEWQWLNKSGTKKEKYVIEIDNEKAFAFAGIYCFNTKLNALTFSMLTTQANALMSEIHNIKKRMPIILKPNDEKAWLDGANYNDFAFPYEVNLKATSLDSQFSLF